MAAKKDPEPQPTAAELTTETPAAQVELRIGNKVTFTEPDRDLEALGTVVGLRGPDAGVTDEALVQWNAREEWMPLKKLTVQP